MNGTKRIPKRDREPDLEKDGLSELTSRTHTPPGTSWDFVEVKVDGIWGNTVKPLVPNRCHN